MKHKSILTFLIVLLTIQLKAQEPKPNNYGIVFSGFVRSDFFYDTRQVAAAREGNFLICPEPILKDKNGNDINAKSSLNFLAICTRLHASITAPDVLGAKISADFEGEFFGHSDADINGFRLRLAYVKMKWPKTELIMGQYWHPLFVPDAAVIPISFNTGAPFQPVSRFPQIRISHEMAHFRILAMVYTERDHTSFGPNYADVTKPVASGVYMKNAAIPALNLQLHYRPEGSHFIIGAGIDHKTLLPELFTTGAGGMKYKSSTTISSISYSVFTKIITKAVLIRAAAYMSENAADMVGIGGYACSNITDSVTGARAWTNISTSTVWLDVSNTNPMYKVALFMGYTKNLGAKEDINTPVFCSRGKDVDYVYRLAPRFTYLKNKLELDFELEYTVAAYGTTGIRGKVSNTYTVSNLRPLVVVALIF
ncbi:MAG: hypothetical protein WCO63_13670 [Bacteroidota bacterium]